MRAKIQLTFRIFNFPNEIPDNMPFIRLVLFICCLCGALYLPAQSSQATIGSWQLLASSDGSTPVARHEAAFVRVGKLFYLLGGRGIRPVSIYDPKNNTWTEGQKPPIEIHHFQPVVYDDKIYIICALTGAYPGETPIPNVMIYDPAQDKWSEGASIPEARRRGSAGLSVYRHKIYIACGIKDGHRGDHKNWLDVYDPRTGEWLQLPDAPHARDHFQAAAVKGRIYLLGGRRSSAGTEVFSNLEPAVDVFDLRSGKWSTLENPLPTPRAGNFITQPTKQKIMVLGGETGTQQLAHSENEVLDLQTHQWQKWASLQQGRHGTGAILYRGRIYVASGCGNRGGSPELNTMEVLEFRKQ